MKKSVLILALVFAASTLLMGAARADSNQDIVFIDNGPFPEISLSEAELYEQLKDVPPEPLPAVVMPEGALESVEAEKLIQGETLPGFAPGWDPRSGLPQPDPRVMYTVSMESLKNMIGVAPMTWGSAPSNPIIGPYAPFQRWTWYGNYEAQATQTIGRLFIDKDGDGTWDASCTASVISSRTIATAGHCVSDGAGTWYKKWFFCPSYAYAYAPTYVGPRGCWGSSYATTLVGWHNNKSYDSDIGCIVLNTTGTKIANSVGNVTGWTGRFTYVPTGLMTFSWGYPAQGVFPGNNIVVSASTEWYEVDMYTGDAQVSKYIGSDQTGGCSGGPWWMGLKHKSREFGDTDNNNATDPGQAGPYINGVNSHRRCAGGDCSYPPVSSTAGSFWQEMGSPQFGGGSEAVFSNCFSHE